MKPSNHGREYNTDDLLLFLRTIAEETPGFFTNSEATSIFNIKLTAELIASICRNIQRSPKAVEVTWDKMLCITKHRRYPAGVTHNFCASLSSAFKEFKNFHAKNKENMPNKKELSGITILIFNPAKKASLHGSIESAQEELQSLLEEGIELSDIEVFYSDTTIQLLDVSLKPVINLPK